MTDMNEPRKKKLLSADEELMRVFKLTPDDLDANESGYITPHQIEYIKSGDRYENSTELVIGFIFGVIGLIFVGVGIASIFFENRDLGASFGIGVFGSIFALVGYGSLRSRNMKRRAIDGDLADNRLTRVQGVAVVTPSEHDRDGYIEISDQRFELEEDALKRVQHLDPYLIYYLENSKIVVSMQRIDTDDDNIKDEMVDRVSDVDESKKGMLASD